MSTNDSFKGPGILPAHLIVQLAENGSIKSEVAFAEGQIQPASLDLRLGKKAWRLRASFLPGKQRKVTQAIHDLALHEIDLTKAALLETGSVYIAEMNEALALPFDISATANPKSSTGRIDVFTRVIADNADAFDQIPAGYSGGLFAEISPRSFPILVREGSRLSQMRFRRGVTKLTDAEHFDLHKQHSLVSSSTPSIADGVAVTVDLAGFDRENLLGYRARHFTGLIDVDQTGTLSRNNFWEPIYAQPSRQLILDPGEFYILASREAVHIPGDYAAEMTPFDPSVGEFRVHYAGFFDPGFGAASAGGKGARAVLEVRSRDVPFILEDGQIVARLIYEKMLAPPHVLYGADLQSNYQAQCLKLSKHFI